MQDQENKTPVSVDQVLKYNQITETEVYGYPTTVLSSSRGTGIDSTVDYAVMLDGRLPCVKKPCLIYEGWRDALILKEAEKNKQKITISGKYDPSEKVLKIESFKISEQK